MYAIVFNKSYLHTDGKFYNAFISMRGCHPKLYKSVKAAEKKALELSRRGGVSVNVERLPLN